MLSLICPEEEGDGASKRPVHLVNLQDNELSLRQMRGGTFSLLYSHDKQQGVEIGGCAFDR